MDKVTPSFQLDYGPPGTWVLRPRLWRLAMGLLTAAGAAAAMPWISGWPGGWASATDVESRLVVGALAVGGMAMALHAVAHDLFQVEWACFSAEGLHVRWSCVPNLWQVRVEQEQRLAWRDVGRLEWREGSLEHDLKQHLVLQLKTPLCAGRNRLKLLVCDDRDVGHCAALAAVLPTSVVAPAWLATARSRHQNNTA